MDDQERIQALIALYGHWGDHPEWTVDEWILEVKEKNTRRGYWAWVADSIEGEES